MATVFEHWKSAKIRLQSISLSEVDLHHANLCNAVLLEKDRTKYILLYILLYCRSYPLSEVGLT